jgi:protease-4
MTSDSNLPGGEPGQPRASGPGSAAGESGTQAWERGVLEKLAMSAIEERRRARRWGIFFKLLGFAYLGIVIAMVSGFWPDGGPAAASKHTALVDMDGVIENKGEVSADSINAALRSAFEDKKTAGVVLRINSPGGSPVQAGIIHDEIRRLREKYPDTPLYAVVEEVAASGGYYVAVAADRIFVDKASMVGSIGVLMDGFGFVGAMDKLGVERRLLTAGQNKGFLDSFSPLNEEHRRIAQTMLGDVHRQFIDVVRKGRGDRLKDDPEIFSGLVWTGERSVALGLADSLGTVDSVARDVIKAEDVVDFSPHENLAERLAKRVGASAGQALARVLSVGGSSLRLQ